MNKPQKPKTRTQSAVMRRKAREEYVAALAEGRRQRAVTFSDRRKAASSRAARGRTYRGEYA